MIHCLQSDKPMQNFVVSGVLVQVAASDPHPSDIEDSWRTDHNLIEGNDIVRPDGVDLPEAKKQPADLTEILRASVAAAKGGGRGKSDEDTKDTKSSAKPKSRRKASA